MHKFKTDGKGLAFGMTSGILWAVDTVFLAAVMLMTPFKEYAALAPIVSACLHDIFSTVWMTLYMAVRGKLPGVLKAMKTRSGRFIMLAALCGGPLGMTGYLLAIKYIGASLTAPISALYPAVGALLAYFFLKDKLGVKGICGLSIAIIATGLMGWTGTGQIENFVIGFLCALLCAVGWGSECVISAYGMQNDVTPEEALNIRQLVSAVVYVVLVVPIFGGLGGFTVIGECFSNVSVLALLGVALAGTASYTFYYKAIDRIGPTRAMALNISYSAWAIVINAVLFYASGAALGQTFSWMTALCAVAIIVGSVLTSKD